MRTRKQNLESRIRELDRQILHCKDVMLRNIYKEHKEYLKSELNKLQPKIKFSSMYGEFKEQC